MNGCFSVLLAYPEGNFMATKRYANSTMESLKFTSKICVTLPLFPHSYEKYRGWRLLRVHRATTVYRSSREIHRTDCTRFHDQASARRISSFNRKLYTHDLSPLDFLASLRRKIFFQDFQTWMRIRRLKKLEEFLN